MTPADAWRSQHSSQLTTARLRSRRRLSRCPVALAYRSKVRAEGFFRPLSSRGTALSVVPICLRFASSFATRTIPESAGSCATCGDVTQLMQNPLRTYLAWTRSANVEMTIGTCLGTGISRTANSKDHPAWRGSLRPSVFGPSAPPACRAEARRLVEQRGIEPLTSSLRTTRSTN